MSPESVALQARFDGLDRSMREFLAVLEASTPEDDRVNTSWLRCSEAFACLGEAGELLQSLQGQARAAAEERLDELVRLNAVLSAAVRRQRDELVGQLDHARNVRNAMTRLGSATETGGTCDLSG